MVGFCACCFAIGLGMGWFAREVTGVVKSGKGTIENGKGVMEGEKGEK